MKHRNERPMRLPSSAHVPDWRTVGTPKLPARARRYLRERGISREVWRINNVRFLRPRETAALWGPHCHCPAILFPFSKTFASARLLGRKGSDRFRTPDGATTETYVPVLPKSKFKNTSILKARADTTQPLIIGESMTRALAAVSAGLLAIANTSCWTWQKDRQVKPEWARWALDGRIVPLLFDADVTENDQVLWPYLLFGDRLTERGAEVQYIKLPRVAGRKTGLDDYLAKYGAKGFNQLRRYSWDSKKVESLRMSAMRRTEGGLAELTILRHGQNIRHDSDEKRWYGWNGILWQPESSIAPSVQEAVKNTVRWIGTEAQKVKNEDRRKAMAQWSMSCDRKAAVQGAMILAATDRRLQIRATDLDTDPYMLGTRSGIVDLRTGKLLHGARHQLITRSVATVYDASADCPRWKTFLHEVMCGEPRMVRFLQRLAGYFLIGRNSERLLFFLYGVGRNGKSVFIETLLKLFGDYGTPAKSEMLMRHRVDRDSESAQPFALQLRGARLITASEVGEHMELDEGVVKSLTGNDEITVRGLHRAPIRFVIHGKILVRCNYRPQVNSTDQAIWDRIIEVPFNHRIKTKDQQKDLPDILIAELPGILQWAIDGALDYQENGLRVPKLVRQQTRDYRASMDSVSRWFDEKVETDSIATCLVSTAYDSYVRWCRHGSNDIAAVLVAALSRRKFVSKLKQMGYESERTKNGKRFRGFAIENY